VENALMEESEFKPRAEMVKELGSLRDEVRKLREDLKLKNVVIDKYESELKRYRSATFLEGGFEGAREYNQELVELLKRKTVIDSYRILEELGIDPAFRINGLNAHNFSCYRFFENQYASTL
jgi:hypothetical protein